MCAEFDRRRSVLAVFGLALCREHIRLLRLVCVCVYARERERKRNIESETQWERRERRAGGERDGLRGPVLESIPH